MNKKQKNYVKLGAFLLIIVAIFFIVKYFNLEQYADAERVREVVESYGIFAPIIYIIIYNFVTIFFLPGSPVTILGGIIFGTVNGTIYTVIGATIGATLSFLIARYLARPFVEDLIEKKLKKIKEYDEKLERNGFSTVLFFRLVPIFPFNGLNFALGLTKVKLRDYFLATAIGIVPGTFAYTYFGDSLATLSPINIIAAVLLMVALGLALPTYKYLKKRFSKNNAQEENTEKQSPKEIKEDQKKTETTTEKTKKDDGAKSLETK